MANTRKTNPKIALIGSGNIGGTLAYSITSQGLGDVVLLDRTSTVAQGKALDIAQAIAVAGSTAKLSGTCDYADISEADIVIITAGVARKPNMSRDELLSVNVDVMKTVADGVTKHAPNAFVVVVTNPLDIMVYAFQKHSGLPANKVVGMAGILDSGRFKHFLALELGVAETDIKTMVLGGHGDTMVPLIGCTSIAGMPLQMLIRNGSISETRIQEIVQRTRDGGAEIVKLLQTGSAYYAPAASAVEMAKAYLFNQKRLMPCSAYLNGEYGVKGMYVGVPVVIGNGGVERVVEIELSDHEKTAFDKSVQAVQTLVDALGK